VKGSQDLHASGIPAEFGDSPRQIEEMMQMGERYCPICERIIRSWELTSKQFKGVVHPMCEDCANRLDELERKIRDKKLLEILEKRR